jgi:hypothetical protein
MIILAYMLVNAKRWLGLGDWLYSSIKIQRIISIPKIPKPATLVVSAATKIRKVGISTILSIATAVNLSF